MNDQAVADRISANLLAARQAAAAEGATETARHLDKLTLSLTRAYLIAVNECDASINWNSLPCADAARGGGPKPPAPDQAEDVDGDEPDA